MATHQLVYHWKHGWIPLTHAAALSKAHGNAKAADRYVPGTSDHHAPRTVHGSARGIHAGLEAHRSSILGKNLTKMSDDSLTSLLNNASDDEVDYVLKEFDRRDRAMRAARRAAEKRQAKQRDRDDQYDRLVNGGADPETAYAQVYGVPVERQRREQAIASLRQNGFKGAGFDELTRVAFRDYLEQSYWDAEAATNGAMFRGTTRQDDHRNPRMLFNGSEAFARANASEELLAYWRDHGRLSLADFRASMLGGHLTTKETAAWL